MQPNDYRAVEIRGGWHVMAYQGGEPIRCVASGISSEEMARTIAALLNLNTWCAHELESGRIDVVRKGNV